MCYSYINAIRNDIINYTIPENIDKLKAFYLRDGKGAFLESLMELAESDDSVTGNLSGSYTCNRGKAADYLHDDYDTIDYITDMVHDGYFITAKECHKAMTDPKYMDVCIRVYLVERVINEFSDDFISMVN